MISTYTHVQASASNTWSISHNLNRKPVFDSTLNLSGINTVVLPAEATHVDDNTLVLSFTSPFTGSVRLV